ncbi:glycosyltransferase [Bacillus cytotoxicus]|uniref:glycosyltransferase family 2 protein n=1 Tax=Bacillus cereus group sp. BfR-BA-01492 TaxID=2920361 RepID=UPI001F5A84EA|nr:glycosyltransferase [Bacillus cereus group sp. BfR-BA-01492]EMA6342531.1 glycosyltransferase family 2 protein [Bacillus cytotoxicus]
MMTLIILLFFLLFCILVLLISIVFSIKYVLICTAFLFSALLAYYSLLTIAGLIHRNRKKKEPLLEHYPSVDIFIPAHNEGIVMKDTLEAIAKIEYPGQLTIYLLNDNSKDETPEIGDAFDKAYAHIRHIRVPPGEPKGKSRVLNYGLSISNGKYFCVYDADNQPEPHALRMLVQYAETTEDAVGAVGHVRTINEKRNWLTRMISLEFQIFQLLMQSGRWLLFQTGSLTGTNMLLRRSAVEELGGYDPYAIAEDAELTLRITQKGYVLPIVPESVTWEQEPEHLKILIKQRTRWLQGNLYILEKIFSSFSFFKGKLLVHSLQQVLVYLVFWLFLIISNVWFIVGLLGLFHIQYTIPLLFMWYVAYITYTAQLFSSQSVERTFTPINIFISIMMYFTYAQLFTYLFIRSLILYLRAKSKKQVIGWDKTVRFKKEK